MTGEPPSREGMTIDELLKLLGEMSAAAQHINEAEELMAHTFITTLDEETKCLRETLETAIEGARVASNTLIKNLQERKDKWNDDTQSMLI